MMLISRQYLLASVLLCWMVVFFVAVRAHSPPPAGLGLSLDGEFSASNARAILKELVGDGIPHPSGSGQNVVVRERIVAYLRESGYEPQLQSTRKSQNDAEIAITNVVARRRGARPGRAIMVAAHYDSVDEGPGACDDGVGVAVVLEVARMIQYLPSVRNDFVVLITDGEEIGRLGAKAFVREHPWAKDVEVVINLEARGTTGRSLLFEMSDEDEWLVDLYSKHVARPATSSLYSEAYRRLPFDTDFTVFKRHGMEGYNFAFIGNPRYFHSPDDDYEHADPRSLRHHGDNTWQLARALVDFDLDARTEGRAIHTDVLGLQMVWWRKSFNLTLAVCVLALTCSACGIAKHRRLLTLSWRVVALIPVAILAVILAEGLCELGFRVTGVFDDTWTDAPIPIAMSYAGLSIFVFVGCFWWYPSRTDSAWCVWACVWLLWNSSGLLAAWFVPGASYLFLLPGAVAAALGFLASALPKRLAEYVFVAGLCVAPVAMAVLVLPLSILLFDAVELFVRVVYPVCGVMLALAAGPLASYCAQSTGDARLPILVRGSEPSRHVL